MKRLGILAVCILAVCVLAVCVLALAGPARADSIDGIYPPDALTEWQVRISTFLQGAYHDVISPAFTDDERHRLVDVRLDFPLSAPGQEPLAFWRDGDTVHLSIASLKFVRDLMLSYVWLGRNQYQETSLQNYMLMLSCWRNDESPRTPPIALHVPTDAEQDPATETLVTHYTQNAWQFMLLYELGHVLHDPPRNGPDTGHTMAMEIAADKFALDVLGRLHQVPVGTAVLFQMLTFYDSITCDSPQEAARHTHPLDSERLRQVALDIDGDAKLYAKNADPDTLGMFHDLSAMTGTLADQLANPAIRADLQQRSRTVSSEDLVPVSSDR